MIRPLKGCVLGNWLKIALANQVFPVSWGLRFPKFSKADFIRRSSVDCRAGCLVRPRWKHDYPLSELSERKAAAQCSYLLYVPDTERCSWLICHSPNSKAVLRPKCADVMNAPSPVTLPARQGCFFLVSS